VNRQIRRQLTCLFVHVVADAGRVVQQVLDGHVAADEGQIIPEHRPHGARQGERTPSANRFTMTKAVNALVPLAMAKRVDSVDGTL